MKNIEIINTYLSGKTRKIPNWLKYLVETEEIHQNYENVESLSELSTNSLLNYVIRTLESLEKLSVDEETYRILETVLVYSEVAKGGSLRQRRKWLENGFNLMIHNEGSKSIYWEEIYTALHVEDIDERRERFLIADLILTHGLIGQYIRGEARLDSHVSMIHRFYERYTEEKLKNILYYLNLCIIEGVSPSLWNEVKEDVKSVIDGLFNGNVESFSSRMHRLTHKHRETVAEKERIMGDKELLVQNFLADKDLWYVEPAMHDLSFEDIWTIFLMIKDAVSDSKIHHIHFETLMQQLHYDFKGKKHNNVYRKRVIEKYLHEYRENKNPDNTHVSFHVEVDESMQTAHISFKFSAVGEALITFCVEAEKVDMMHNRANILLFDFFGLRKDAYDRFHNEELYLEHMNSSADDKRIILDYIKGDTIVDVGPGGGVMLDMIEEETEGKDIYGIDISQNVIDSLKQKKQNESRSWDVIKGDALNFADTFKKESVDTIVYSSIFHELFSYIEYDGKKFNKEVIKKGLQSAYEALKPGGRIIIRDGIMTEDKDLMRVIRFKDESGLKFLEEYAREFKGREIQYEVLSDNTVKMPVNDAMEFLYTYTWGEDSFAHEVQEQFGIFTPNEYKEFVSSIFGDKVKIIKAVNYLQEGYTIHLKEKIDFEDESGNAVALPDSTFFMVLEKAD
ncbi:class I SAM-dependent methyltransferase [Bacillus cereus group sp. BfR-BA-01363]|uniref:class I SAM-dependent methyltransferase n=1 Tax=Bacillus cereus group sp. BfR-BA-01363 TaxID=3094882 RepID=UPI0029C2985C|nr:class I SAM-dependent methyltransferase [Bacillus cereus group sp. BfR-BA-01363]MDX5853132.1 class I SAM-dependent methyltransferase [Bacillus cereus group sp. BfR-BA-01363]